MSSYFLTGASGAVGSAIVPLLCADEGNSLRILLRAKSDEHLQQRFEELCQFWELPSNAETRSRIVPLRGDASVPRFGLTDDEYGSLCKDTSHIIHCAASVRMNLSLEDARRSAVGSAVAVLALARQLAAQGTLRKVDFVSTVGIAGKRSGALPEIWIDEAREFHNTYEQSKSEAECLVRAAIEQEGMPITVHRPSMVIGDSQSGKIVHFQIFYFICEFLSGRKTAGIYPDFKDVRLDVIPVDWVAGAIVASSTDAGTCGRIFHLCSGPHLAPRLEDLKSVVREAYRAHGLKIPMDCSLPRTWFAALARLSAWFVPAEKRGALATLPIYLDYLADRQGFDNASYRSWLNGRSLELPSPESYLPAVLTNFLRKRY